MIINVKKIWNGWASVRSPIVHKLMDDRDDLIVNHNGKRMTITFDELEKSLHQVHKSKFWSKIDRKYYELFDFTWREDNEN